MNLVVTVWEKRPARHCEACIRFGAGRSNLASSVGVARGGPVVPPRHPSRRDLRGHGTAKAPGRSLFLGRR